MKISYNWLKEILDIDVPDQVFSDKVTLTSLEVEDFEQPGKKVAKIVTGHIVSIKDHPDSDHLKVCQVDIGNNEIVQIVCGAPNVTVDSDVAVALVGAVMPDGSKIKKGKLRGEESFGMICGLDELGIPEKLTPKEVQNGIYVFPEPVAPGMNAVDLLWLNDTVFDIDITPNRADSMSIRGLGYEIGADFNIKPDIKSFNTVNSDFDAEVKVTNKVGNALKEYMFEEVIVDQNKLTSLQISRRLWNSNVQPSNMLADVSNMIILGEGQPAFVYDIDKLPSLDLVIDFANPNESFKDNGNDYTLDENDVVIRSGDQIIAVAGVKVLEAYQPNLTTKKILIEMSDYASGMVRKTAGKLNLRSETSSRIERGVDAGNFINALNYGNSLINSDLTASFSNIVEVTKEKPFSAKISMNLTTINDRLGADLVVEDIIEVMDRLLIETSITNDDEFEFTIPSRRFDLVNEADMLEEIIRISGYDHLKATLPTTHGTIGFTNITEQKIKKIRKYLTGIGLSQVINYELITDNSANKFNYLLNSSPLKVDYPMTEDHEYLRHSLISGLLDNIAYNQARKQDDLFLFEDGNVFDESNGRPKQIQMVAGALTGSMWPKQWNTKKDNVDFFVVKGLVIEFLHELGIFNTVNFKRSDANELHPGQSADIYLDDKLIGFFGRVHPQTEKSYGIKETYIFEFNFAELMNINVQPATLEEINKFTPSSRDISVLVQKNVTNHSVIESIVTNGSDYLSDITLTDVYEGNNISDSEKSFTYALKFEAEDQQITDEEVNKAMDSITNALVSKLGATIR